MISKPVRAASFALAIAGTIFPAASAGQVAQPLPEAAEGAAARGRALVVASTRPLSLIEGRLAGPGAELLQREARDAQFVLLAESHNDAVTPRFVSALFDDLSRAAGYRYLAVEQDPFGMEAASAPPLRGRVEAIARHAKRYPFQYTFTTDEELRMIADVGRASRVRSRPVWGVDQAFGASLPLEELARSAPNARAAAAVASLLEEARGAERLKAPSGGAGPSARLFRTSTLGARSRELLPRYMALREAYRPRPGSRADELIGALETSTQIFDYNRRAVGEPTGLLSNTEREAWMKARFLREYRAAEKRDGRAPKVVYKAGSFHVTRGLTPAGVFTLGGMLHEFAAANGGKAVSLQLIPMGTWYAKPDDLSADYRVLHQPFDLKQGSIVDLRPLRAHHHRGETFGMKTADERRAFRNLIFSHDFMAFLPSEEAGYALVGPNVYD